MKPNTFSFSKEEQEKLEIYCCLIKSWQKKVNLVGASTLENMWERHVIDSAQLYHLLPPVQEGKVLYDIGSGAGFPGLVLAIMGRKALVLCEANKKKCAFKRSKKKNEL